MGSVMNRYCRRCGRLVQVYDDAEGWHLTIRPGWDEDSFLVPEVFRSALAAINAGMKDHVHGGPL
jgi:hypothetical protein